MAAFAVFADGFYRYPDNEDFRKNTFTSFYRSLKINWKNKDWAESVRLIEEMVILDILKEQDHQNLQNILKNWYHYFNRKDDRQSSEQVKQYLEMFST